MIRRIPVCRVETFCRAVWAATPDNHRALLELYSPNVRFECPLVRVTGVDSLQRILRHTWRLAPGSRFHVRSHAVNGSLVFMRWSLVLDRAGPETSLIDAVAELRFGPDDRVVHHVDYWDSVSAMARIPVLGRTLELLRRRLLAGWDRAVAARAGSGIYTESTEIITEHTEERIHLSP